MTYDVSGNLLSLAPPERAAHAFSWDAKDQVATYAPPDVGFALPATTYTRDNDGLLQQVAPPGAFASIVRDEHGRARRVTDVVTKETAYDPQGRLTSLTTSDGVTLSYGYDGSLVTQQTVTGPFSHVLHRSYDNLFRVSSWDVDGILPVTPTYDGDGFLTALGGMTVTRGNTGLVKTTTLGTVTEAYTYNAFGEVVGRTAPGYSSSYTRDAAGRIATKAETIGGATTTERYTYDAVGRLWQVYVNGATSPAREYTYDANGNRSDGTYDAQDRQVSHGGERHVYSPNGERMSKSDGFSTTTYSYDLNGNLRRATLPSPLAAIDYVVDGLNRRIGKKVGGALTQGFVYDGARIVAEVDGTGALVSLFRYVVGGHSPDVMWKAGQTYRILKDHLGSPRLVVEASTGTVAQRLDYDEWGNVTSDSNPGFQPFGFAGGLWDRDTNLVRFGARDYDPTTGRWTTKDTSRFAGGLNLYGYSNLDPVNYIDVDGKNPIAIGIAIVVFILTMGMEAPSDTKEAPANVLGMGLAVSGLRSLPVGGMCQGRAGAEELAERSAGAAESAYSVASNGGRHAGFLRQANGWNNGQLQRAESSFQAQIEAHESKLGNPSKYAADWGVRSPEAREGLLRHWGKEISNFSEQQSIVQEIIFRRGL
jgi:RHS repeat-associated protein